MAAKEQRVEPRGVTALSSAIFRMYVASILAKHKGVVMKSAASAAFLAADRPKSLERATQNSQNQYILLLLFRLIR